MLVDSMDETSAIILRGGHGPSDRNRHLQQACAIWCYGFGNENPGTLDRLLGTFQTRLREQQDKLIAAPSSEHVAAAQRIQQTSRERAQHAIAEFVPELIVCRLEVVDVKHADRKGFANGVEFVQQPIQLGLEKMPIGDAAYGIDESHLFQFSDSGLPLFPSPSSRNVSTAPTTSPLASRIAVVRTCTATR